MATKLNFKIDLGKKNHRKLNKSGSHKTNSHEELHELLSSTSWKLRCNETCPRSLASLRQEGKITPTCFRAVSISAQVSSRCAVRSYGIIFFLGIQSRAGMVGKKSRGGLCHCTLENQPHSAKNLALTSLRPCVLPASEQTGVTLQDSDPALCQKEKKFRKRVLGWLMKAPRYKKEANKF